MSSQGQQLYIYHMKYERIKTTTNRLTQQFGDHIESLLIQHMGDEFADYLCGAYTSTPLDRKLYYHFQVLTFAPVPEKCFDALTEELPPDVISATFTWHLDSNAPLDTKKLGVVRVAGLDIKREATKYMKDLPNLVPIRRSGVITDAMQEWLKSLVSGTALETSQQKLFVAIWHWVVRPVVIRQ